jgi:hypothetical protein
LDLTNKNHAINEKAPLRKGQRLDRKKINTAQRNWKKAMYIAPKSNPPSLMQK